MIDACFTIDAYVAALQCHRRLWLARRQPGQATEPDPAGLVLQSQSADVRAMARGLYPGGVEVGADAQEVGADAQEVGADAQEVGADAQEVGADAQEDTRRWVEDPAVPAIFGAAIEIPGVRVRIDVLERVAGGFGVRAVRASKAIKDDHLDDVVLQVFAARGAGLQVPSVEIVHLRPDYVRGDGEIDVSSLFQRHDVSSDVEFLLSDVPEQLERHRAVLASELEPAVDPSPHCRRPRPCPFLDHCARGRPADWLYRLPGLRAPQFHALLAQGVDTIRGIPDGFEMGSRQRRAREAWLRGGVAVSRRLARRLQSSGPPAAYLDFETTNPAIPVHPGTRPFDPLAFQWSLHRWDAEGRLTHDEFLADARTDPRREFASTLIRALSGDAVPILVYSDFEHRVLEGLAAAFDDLAPALRRIEARLFDLLPVVRDSVYAPGFGGSFSIKSVAPALAPDFSYAGLPGVANGAQAAVALGRLGRRDLPAVERQTLRRELLAYCARDTEALLVLHRALLDLAPTRPSPDAGA